jgi:hypothetical protein
MSILWVSAGINVWRLPWIRGVTPLKFIVAESNVFTVDPITSFYNVFGGDRANDPDQALRITAKQVMYIISP